MSSSNEIHSIDRRRGETRFANSSHCASSLMRRSTTRRFVAGRRKIDHVRFDKLFHAFTFLLCCVLFLWQMSLSLYRYWDYPLSTLVTINNVGSVYLPSITMCNNNYRFYDMLLRLAGKYTAGPGYVVPDVPCYDLEQFWRDYGVEKHQVSATVTCDFYAQYDRNLTECKDYHCHGELTTDVAVQTILGQCVDLTLDYPAHQRIIGIAIHIDDNKNIRRFYGDYSFREYFNIYAHDKSMLYKNDIFINTRAPQFAELWLIFEKKEDVRGHIDCLNNCVEDKLIALVDCRLPHMTSTSGLPMCANWTSVLTVYNVIHRLHATGELYNCSCTRACAAVEFKMNRIESMKLLNNENNITVMSIELENRFDEIVRESYVYPFAMLINDFSALIGFFLGVSLPGLIGVAETCGIRALVYYKKSFPNT